MRSKESLIQAAVHVTLTNTIVKFQFLISLAVIKITSLFQCKGVKNATVLALHKPFDIMSRNGDRCASLLVSGGESKAFKPVVF